MGPGDGSVDPVEARAPLGAMQLAVDPVVADGDPEGRLDVDFVEFVPVDDLHLAADDQARVVLLHLRAVLDPVGLERGGDPVVGEQLEPVADAVRARLEVGVLGEAALVRGDGLHALGGAPLGRIERVPAAQAVRAAVARWGRRAVTFAADRARREHPRGAPGSTVGRQRERGLAAIVERVGDLHVAVEAIVVVGVDRWAVVVEDLGGYEHAPVRAEVGRLEGNETRVPPRADLHLRGALGRVIGHAEVHRAGGGEVARARRVRPLGRVERFDRLGDDEVQIGEALAVAVADHVDWRAVDGEGDVRPVVGVEAAEEVLLRLAAAGVLHGEQTGDRLDEVLRLVARAEHQLVVAGVRVGRRGRRRGRALGDDQGRLIGAALLGEPGAVARGGSGCRRRVAHRRCGCRRTCRSRLARKREGERQLQRRAERSVASPGGLEGPALHRQGRGLVEAMPRRLADDDRLDRAVLADLQLEPHGPLEPVVERLGRILRRRVHLEDRRGGVLRLGREARSAGILRVARGGNRHDGEARETGEGPGRSEESIHSSFRSGSTVSEKS